MFLFFEAYVLNYTPLDSGVFQTTRNKFLCILAIFFFLRQLKLIRPFKTHKYASPNWNLEMQIVIPIRSPLKLSDSDFINL